MVWPCWGRYLFTTMLVTVWPTRFSFFFFFNDTATTEIYTLSLHDALPISQACGLPDDQDKGGCKDQEGRKHVLFSSRDRKSTRLNSSHLVISYAVFCLKKKKKRNKRLSRTAIRNQCLRYATCRLLRPTRRS